MREVEIFMKINCKRALWLFIALLLAMLTFAFAEASADQVVELEGATEAIGPERVTLRVEPNMGHASDPLYADEILAEVDAFIRGDR